MDIHVPPPSYSENPPSYQSLHRSSEETESHNEDDSRTSDDSDTSNVSTSSNESSHEGHETVHLPAYTEVDAEGTPYMWKQNTGTPLIRIVTILAGMFFAISLVVVTQWNKSCGRPSMILGANVAVLSALSYTSFCVLLLSHNTSLCKNKCMYYILYEMSRVCCGCVLIGTLVQLIVVLSSKCTFVPPGWAITHLFSAFTFFSGIYVLE